jgi:hypothetical protein
MSSISTTRSREPSNADITTPSEEEGEDAGEDADAGEGEDAEVAEDAEDAEDADRAGETVMEIISSCEGGGCRVGCQWAVA